VGRNHYFRGLDLRVVVCDFSVILILRGRIDCVVLLIMLSNRKVFSTECYRK